MSLKKIDKSIKIHVKKKNYVRISRGYKNDIFGAITGYLVASSKNFVLIAEIEDFYFFGFHCIPIRTITNIRRNKNDEYFGMIFEKESPKVFKKIFQKSNSINLNSFQNILKNLKNQNECVIIESERIKDDLFSIGHIQKISKKTVAIKHFNAQGFLEEPIKEKLQKITKITYQDNYSNTFKKYIRS
ncbi:MAG: hypothetical protein AB8B65_12310 [Kordia sp.]|uniref:hypothetical protein n=1 Tax=Kordia sp. TaxID=1965332 RepID=UPI003859FB1E